MHEEWVLLKSYSTTRPLGFFLNYPSTEDFIFHITDKDVQFDVPCKTHVQSQHARSLLAKL